MLPAHFKQLNLALARYTLKIQLALAHYTLNTHVTFARYTLKLLHLTPDTNHPSVLLIQQPLPLTRYISTVT